MPVDMPPAASTGGAVPSWGSAARISDTSKKVLGVAAPPWPPASVPVRKGKEKGEGEGIVLSGVGGRTLGYDDIDLPLVRRDKGFLDGGRLEEDERLGTLRMRVCGRGPDVFYPAIDVIAEGEPDGSHAVLDDGVDELLGGPFVLIQDPAIETVPDGKWLVGFKLWEAVPNEGEVLLERLWGPESCEQTSALG